MTSKRLIQVFAFLLSCYWTFGQILLGNHLPNGNLKCKTIPDIETLSCVANQGYSLPQVCKMPSNGFMHDVEKCLRKENDLVDKSDCIGAKQYADTVDFVVVGAGTAGCVVARRLAEAGFKTLLLEAGGPAPVGMQIPSEYGQYLGDPDYDWNFKLEKMKTACLSTGGVCKWPRGKVMGGTNQLNGMMYMRGYPQDFDDLNIPGWHWKEILPYYLKSEDNTQIGTYADEGYHGKGGYLTVSQFPYVAELSKFILKGAKELGYQVGHDMNGVHRTGFTVAQANIRNGARLSTVRAFVYEAKPKINTLFIQHSAFVTKVIFRNKTAVGVEYQKGGRLYQVKATKEVILSAGTVQSPQLLMLSGIGDQNKLEPLGINTIKNLPGVGKNLKNHVSITLSYFIKNHSNALANPMNWKSVNEFIKHRTGPLTSPGLSPLTGFIHSKESDCLQAPDLQIFFSGYQANCSMIGEVGAPYLPNIQNRIVSVMPTLLQPKSEGYLELADQYPHSPPKIYANLLKDSHDVKILIDGVRKVQTLMATKPLREKLEMSTTVVQNCSSHDFDSDSYWECAIRWNTNPENHQVGTCSFGLDGDAVTNPRLQVRGVENLRVIDASVFPMVPSGNLNAPVIMVAEKGSAMILEDWKKTSHWG